MVQKSTMVDLSESKYYSAEKNPYLALYSSDDESDYDLNHMLTVKRYSDSVVVQFRFDYEFQLTRKDLETYEDEPHRGLAVMAGAFFNLEREFQELAASSQFHVEQRIWGDTDVHVDTERGSIEDLLAKAKEAIGNLPPEEQEKLYEETRQSFARGNVALSQTYDPSREELTTKLHNVQGDVRRLNTENGNLIDTNLGLVRLLMRDYDKNTAGSILRLLDTLKRMSTKNKVQLQTVEWVISHVTSHLANIANGAESEITSEAESGPD